MNDNPPIITINPIGSTVLEKVKGEREYHQLIISEAVPVGTLLAAITVSDRDEHDEERIDCTSSSHHFLVEPIDPGAFI